MKTNISLALAFLTVGCGPVDKPTAYDAAVVKAMRSSPPSPPPSFMTEYGALVEDVIVIIDRDTGCQYLLYEAQSSRPNGERRSSYYTSAAAITPRNGKNCEKPK